MFAFAASFVWYWFPDFIFPALGYFTWVCWIAPRNPVVNQVFGMKSGIGLLPFTFDCEMILKRSIRTCPLLNKHRQGVKSPILDPLLWFLPGPS